MLKLLPIVPYKSSKQFNETCPICLDEYKEGENVRQLSCDHVYHLSCIDPWLLEKSSQCPLCKTDVNEAIKKKDPSIWNVLIRPASHNQPESKFILIKSLRFA